MMKYEEFCKNELVVSFIKYHIDIHFQEEYIPYWVNFDMFKTKMFQQISRDLYTDIEYDFWWRNMLVPFISLEIGGVSLYDCFLDTCCAYYVGGVPEVPDNIKSLLN